ICFLSIAIVFEFITLAVSIPPPQKLIVDEASSSAGYWETKTKWKAYWVKSWIPRLIYVPVWKKIWGPINIKQWVPLPRPPPGLKQ
ncbi:hypothetical protein Trydic_g15938, partial [Trypoxylus dichotomus]